MPDRRPSAALQGVIERQIIPRLLMIARRDAEGDFEPIPDRREIGAAEVAEFSQLVVDHEIDFAQTYLDGMRSQGISVERLLLELMAPTARQLGRRWEEDSISFVDVTVALSRLQQLLRHLRPAEPIETSARDDGRRALILPAPGEQHTFGLLIVEDFLRTSGWQVWGGQAMARQDMRRILRNYPFAFVGFSLSSDRLLRRLALAIQSVRRTSSNPGVRVIVGGRVFVEQPELVARVGADALARDARHAVEVANALFAVEAAPGWRD